MRFPLVEWRPPAPAERAPRYDARMEAAVPIEHIVDAWREMASKRCDTNVPMFKKPCDRDARERSDLRRRWFGTTTLAIALLCLASVLGSVLYTVIHLNADLDSMTRSLSPTGMGLVNTTVSMFHNVEQATGHGNRMLANNMPVIDAMMNDTTSIVGRLETLLRKPTITISLDVPPGAGPAPSLA